MGDVVVDPDREVAERLRCVELGEDRRRHRGRELLRGEAVAAAEHARREPVLLHQRRHDVFVERLADRPGILAAVEDGQCLRRLRERGGERGRVERPVEAHLEHADLLAARRQCGDRLFDDAGAGAHHHDHALRVGRARVVERVVTAPGELGEPVEAVGDDLRRRRIERVGGLARLEEDVRVLRGAAHDGMIGAERAARCAFTSSSSISARRSSSARPSITFTSCEVRKPSKKCTNGTRARSVAAIAIARSRGLPARRGAEQREAGAAGGHHVAVVAEDREGVRRQRAGGDVHDERRQLACDLEHVREHQQQALRRREGRRQRPGLERSVDGAGRARPRTASRSRTGRRPRGSAIPLADHSSASSPMVDAGVIG